MSKAVLYPKLCHGYEGKGEFPFCWKCWQRHFPSSQCSPNLTVSYITIHSLATTGEKGKQ